MPLLHKIWEAVCVTFITIVFQVLFLASLSRFLKNGTALLTLACSAKPCWTTCTRTRLTGSACSIQARLQKNKLTPVLRAVTLKKEKEKTSLKSSSSFLGNVLSSNVGKSYSCIFAATPGSSKAPKMGAVRGWLPLVELESNVALQV